MNFQFFVERNLQNCLFLIRCPGSKEDPSKQIRIQVNMAHSSAHTERSIHEMLKDTPSMNESNSAIHSGIEGRAKHPSSLHIRTNSGMFILQILEECFIDFFFKFYLQLQPHRHQ